MKRENKFLTALALAGGLVFLSPVLYSIWMSFQTAQSYYTGKFEFTLDNYTAAIGQYNFARYLLNSLFVSGTVTILSLTVATMAAFAFARFSFRGRDLLFGATVATLMIPSHITLIPNYLTLAKAGLLDTYAGLILPAISNGFAAFFLRQYIRGIPEGTRRGRLYGWRDAVAGAVAHHRADLDAGDPVDGALYLPGRMEQLHLATGRHRQ